MSTLPGSAAWSVEVTDAARLEQVAAQGLALRPGLAADDVAAAWAGTVGGGARHSRSRGDGAGSRTREARLRQGGTTWR